MARKSSTVQSNPSVDDVVAAVLKAMGQTAETPTPSKGKGKATRSSGTAAQAANIVKGKTKREIRDPEARASVKQVYRLAALLFEAHYGEALPKPLTMGDVQVIFDDLEASAS